MNTPTGQVLAAADNSLMAHDRGGRLLTVRRLGALDRLRLFKTIGAELAENAPYLGMAMLAVSVSAIDSVPIPPPVTEAQLEALVQRLGDDGIAAVAECLTDNGDGSEARLDPGN